MALEEFCEGGPAKAQPAGAWRIHMPAAAARRKRLDVRHSAGSGMVRHHGSASDVHLILAVACSGANCAYSKARYTDNGDPDAPEGKPSTSRLHLKGTHRATQQQYSQNEAPRRSLPYGKLEC